MALHNRTQKEIRLWKNWTQSNNKYKVGCHLLPFIYWWDISQEISRVKKSWSWNSNAPFTSNEIMTKLSSRQQASVEVEVLKNCLYLSLLPSRIDEVDVLKNCELIYRCVVKDEKNEWSQIQVKIDLAKAAMSYCNGCWKTKRRLLVKVLLCA